MRSGEKVGLKKNAHTNAEFSFLYYFVQVTPTPMILRYVYRLVSGSIWAFMTIYCLLIKILRSSVFAPQTSGAAVLVCEPFYVKFMSFGDKFITKTKFWANKRNSVFDLKRFIWKSRLPTSHHKITFSNKSLQIKKAISFIGSKFSFSDKFVPKTHKLHIKGFTH